MLKKEERKREKMENEKRGLKTEETKFRRQRRQHGHYVRQVGKKLRP